MPVSGLNVLLWYIMLHFLKELIESDWVIIIRPFVFNFMYYFFYSTQVRGMATLKDSEYTPHGLLFVI